MEKRKFTRFKEDIEVWFQTLYEKGDFSFGKIKPNNISAGGMQLDTEDEKKAGTVLLLKFSIPNYNNKIEAEGEVKWSKRLFNGFCRLGIEFTSISASAREALNKLANS